MTEAINVPTRRGRREISTADMEVGQKPNIVLPNEGPIVREPESIIAAEGPVVDDYADELAFMEQPVTIRLHRSSEKFAPTLIDFYVNGQCEWIPVEVNYKTKRKFVEVIARCKPDDVSTVTGSLDEESPRNEIQRYTRAKYPFTVIEDPSGSRGFDWLAKIMREN